MSAPGVFDLGLQAERTALAWRRTALAMATAALGAAKLAAAVLGAAAVVIGVVGLGAAFLVAAAAGSRYHTTHRSLMAHADLRAVRRPGLPIASLALSGTSVAVLACAFVLYAAS